MSYSKILSLVKNIEWGGGGNLFLCYFLVYNIIFISYVINFGMIFFLISQTYIDKIEVDLEKT